MPTLNPKQAVLDSPDDASDGNYEPAKGPSAQPAFDPMGTPPSQPPTFAAQPAGTADRMPMALPRSTFAAQPPGAPLPPTIQPVNYSPPDTGFAPEAMEGSAARAIYAPQIAQDIEMQRYGAMANYRNTGLAIREQRLMDQEQSAFQKSQIEQQNGAEEARLKSINADYLKAPDGSFQQNTDAQGKPLYKPVTSDVQYDDNGKAFQTRTNKYGDVVSKVDPDEKAPINTMVDNDGTAWVEKQNKYNDWEYTKPEDAIKSNDSRLQGAGARILHGQALDKANTQVNQLQDQLGDVNDKMDQAGYAKSLTSPELTKMQSREQELQTALKAGPPQPTETFFGTKTPPAPELVQSYKDQQDELSSLQDHLGLFRQRQQTYDQIRQTRADAENLKQMGPAGYLQKVKSGAIAPGGQASSPGGVAPTSFPVPGDNSLTGDSSAQTTAQTQPNSAPAVASGLANSPSSSGAAQSPDSTSSQSGTPPPGTPPATGAAPDSSQPTDYATPNGAVSSMGALERGARGAAAGLASGAGSLVGGVYNLAGKPAEMLRGAVGSAIPELKPFLDKVAGYDPNQILQNAGNKLTKMSDDEVAAYGKNLDRVSKGVLGVLPSWPMMLSGGVGLAATGADAYQTASEAMKAKGGTPVEQAVSGVVNAAGSMAIMRYIGSLPMFKEAGAISSALQAVQKGGVAATGDLISSAVRNATHAGVANAGFTAVGQIAQGENNLTPENAKAIWDAAKFGAIFGIPPTIARGLTLRGAANAIDTGHAKAVTDAQATGQPAPTKADYVSGLIQHAQIQEAAAQISKAQTQYNSIVDNEGLSVAQKAAAKQAALSSLPLEIRPVVQAGFDSQRESQAQAQQLQASIYSSLPPANPKLADVSSAKLSAIQDGTGPNTVDPSITPQEIMAEVQRRQAKVGLDQQYLNAVAGVVKDQQAKTTQINTLAQTPDGLRQVQAMNDFNHGLPKGIPKADANTLRLASDISPTIEPGTAVQGHASEYLPVAHAIENLPDADRAFSSGAFKAQHGRELSPEEVTALTASETKADVLQKQAEDTQKEVDQANANAAPLSDGDARIAAAKAAANDARKNVEAVKEGKGVKLLDPGLARLRRLVPQAHDLLTSKDGQPITAQNIAEEKISKPVKSAGNPLEAAIGELKAAKGEREKEGKTSTAEEEISPSGETQAVSETTQNTEQKGGPDKEEKATLKQEQTTTSIRVKALEDQKVKLEKQISSAPGERVPQSTRDRLANTEKALDEARKAAEVAKAPVTDRPLSLQLAAHPAAATHLAVAWTKWKNVFVKMGIDGANPFKLEAHPEGTFGLGIDPKDQKHISLDVSRVSKNLTNLGAIEERAAAVDKLFQEEAIHLAGEKVLGGSSDAEYARQWRTYSPDQQAAFAKLYGGAFDKFSDAVKGAEAFRIQVQHVIDGKATEASRLLTPEARSHWQKVLDYLKGLLTDGDKQTRELVNKVAAMLKEYDSEKEISGQTKERGEGKANDRSKTTSIRDASHPAGGTDVSRTSEGRAGESAPGEVNDKRREASELRESRRPGSPAGYAASLLANGVEKPVKGETFPDVSYEAAILRRMAAIVAAARKLGSYFTPGEIDTKIRSLPSGNVGVGEHEVYLDPPNDRVHKITKPNGFGVDWRNIYAYLQRLHDNNRAFPDLDYQVHGITEAVRGQPQVVSSMKFFKSIDPSHPLTDAEVAEGLKAAGWTEGSATDWKPTGGDVWRHEGRKAEIGDVKWDNFIKIGIDKDGHPILMPIDIITKHDVSDLPPELRPGAAIPEKSPEQERAQKVHDNLTAQRDAGKELTDSQQKMLDNAEKTLGVKQDETRHAAAPFDLKEEDRPKGMVGSSESVFSRTRNFLKDMSKDWGRLAEFTPLKKTLGEFGSKLQTNFRKVQDIMHFIETAVPDPVKREGITNYLQAGGDEKVMRARLDSTTNPKLRPGYEAALKLTDAEKAVANHIRGVFDALRDRAIEMGVDISRKENYMPQEWHKDTISQHLSALGKASLQTSFKNAKNSTFATYHEGEQAGYRPVTKDASKLLGSYMNNLNHVIASRELIEDLSRIKMPDGAAVVVPNWMQGQAKDAVSMVKVESPKGKAVLIAPDDVAGDMFKSYKTIDKPAFTGWGVKYKSPDGTSVVVKSNMLIHPEAHAHLRNIFSQSSLREWWSEPSSSLRVKAAKGASKFLLDDLNKYAKGTLFGMFSPFHAVQEATGALGYTVNPLKDIAHVDVSDPEVQDMMKHTLQLLPDQVSKQMFMEGLGAVNNNLVLKLADAIPSIGPKLNAFSDDCQKWLFEKYIPSLKVKSYRAALARNMDRMKGDLSSGRATVDDVKYKTAREINDAFGHQNYLDLGIHPDILHAAQFLALAPDFLGSRASHFVNAIGGIWHPSNREQTRSLAILGVGMYAGARLINEMWDGDPHWEGENAFNVVHNNRSYTMRSYLGDAVGAFTDFRKFASGRMSPVLRSVVEAGTGQNYRGEPISAKDIPMDFIAGNTPMMLQPFVRGISKTSSESPVSPLEQLAGAVGMHIGRYNATRGIYPLVNSWLDSNGAKYGIVRQQGTYPVSQYSKMRNALDDGDFDQAKREYKALVTSHANAGIKVDNGFKQSLDRKFTGNEEAEKAFVASLSPENKQIYNAAVARQKNLWQRFQYMKTH